MKSRSNLGARFDEGMRRFSERMNVLQDGAMAARIVGEFSAGKTRLLRELFGDMIPEPLAPISSREVQTRLPLEVTYGPAPALFVVERHGDNAQGRELARFERFPERAEVDAFGYLPERHRLRLSLPLDRLVLRGGDGYHSGAEPRRLFLIDMPGWNSGDDDLAEELPDVLLGAEVNLSLVYVSASTRLDSAGNRARLSAFLAALQDAEFLGNARLLFVVTHCASSERAALHARARALVERIWQDVCAGGFGPELDLEVLCADFNTMPAPDLADFRRRFWDFLLEPVSVGRPVAHPWHAAIAQWPAEWDVRPRLKQSHALLGELRQLVARSRVQGNFLNGMNMHRMAGLRDADIRAKVHGEWRKQTGFCGLEALAGRLESLRLDKRHPLAPWWREFWFDQAKLMVAAARAFVGQAAQALDGIASDTEDLEGHLRARLERPYARIQAAVSSSFAGLVDAAGPLADAEPARALSTLLALSALQGRYEQHRAAQLLQLRREVAA
jgi:hypothetical protein